MPTPIAKSTSPSLAGDVLPTSGQVTTPGKASSAALKATAFYADPQAFLGLACDADNQARLNVDPAECVFTEAIRRNLDGQRVNAWNQVAIQFSAAVGAIALDELREALHATKSSAATCIANLVLTVLTYGISDALLSGLKALRSEAAMSVAEHIAQDAPIEWVENGSGILKPGGPLDPSHAIPEPSGLVKLAARTPDAAITAPVSKALDTGKALVTAEFDATESTEPDAQAFLGTLTAHSFKVLKELATPSTTLSDLAIAAQLKVATSPEMEFEALRDAIGKSLRQWIAGHLGRLGVEHRDMHFVDHVASDPDGTDTTRKLVRVEYRGDPRYAVYKAESFTRRSEHVGENSGSIESIVPKELETLAVASHVSVWGAQPEPYRGFVDFTPEPDGAPPHGAQKK
ncbi:MAG TPA: hypothetical protein VGM88_13065 [Kofleriaceae bacterium]|jgi:hypothetical protein